MVHRKQDTAEPQVVPAQPDLPASDTRLLDTRVGLPFFSACRGNSADASQAEPKTRFFRLSKRKAQLNR